jgi:hypothetical protein
VHRRGDDNQARVCIREKKTIADKRCESERERERKKDIEEEHDHFFVSRFFSLFLSAASCAPMRGEQNRMKSFDDWC